VVQEVSQADDILSKLVDKLAPNGDFVAQVTSLRNAAVVHRKRVAELTGETIEENMRGQVLERWDQIIKDADALQNAVTDLRSSMMDKLQKLRMRKTAISELVLAEEFQAAIKAASAPTQTEGTGSRVSLSRMSRAGLVQRKGFGSRLCSSR
jgi:hypothetical protein